MNKRNVKVEKLFKFKTIKHLNHKGFTLLEMLIVFFILSMLIIPTTVVSQIHRISQFQDKQIIELMIMQTQAQAIATIQRYPLAFRVDNQQVFYNEFGNINQALSGDISAPYHASIVFFLGFGRYEFK